MKTTAILLVLVACGNSSHTIIDAPPMGDDAPSIDGPTDASITITGFQIRIAESQIGANGHTRREVLVTGFADDGSLLYDDVVVTLDRASAGTLGADHLTLGPLGARTSFTPCDQATSGCLGPATLTVARASAPNVPLAHVDIALVAPTQVSTIAPCASGGNVFYLDGKDSLRYDMYRVDSATWILVNSPVNFLSLYATPLDPSEGLTYSLEFQTDYSNPIPFTVGTFTGLHALSSVTAGPSLTPNLNDGACPQFTGAYQVHDVTLDAGNHVTSMTLSFEKTCDGSGFQLEGCFHYGP